MNVDSGLAYLGFGSNIGDKKKNILKAYKLLSDKGYDIVYKSSFYASPPWGFEAKEDFINTVIVINTKKIPELILKEIKEIEVDMGRELKKNGGYASRIIDIDILDYHGLVYQSETLTLPHSQIEKRNFVLYPLCEVAPAWIHPVLNIPVFDLVKRSYKDDILLINNE